MNVENYIDLAPADRDNFVYRIVPVKRLLQLFATSRNTLTKPCKWDDPFENFILKSRLRLPTGEHATIGFRDSFYGQCWTLHKASDAMWRIYSPRGSAIRIRSTIRKLAESLSSSRGSWARHEVFVGKVRYLRYKELILFANEALHIGAAPLEMRTFAQTLLVKRLAFKHEREVRLLFIPHQRRFAQDSIFSYTVDPNSLIDQIMIDPRLGDVEAQSLRQKIVSATAFVGEIKRSLLYAPPPQLTIPFAR